MVIADAPLFGVVTIMHGEVIVRGSREAGKVGAGLGFPPHEQVLAEASRFWIQNTVGIRERKSRTEMAALLREQQRGAGAG